MDRVPKFTRNLATFSRSIFAPHFLVSGLAKQNMSPLKMANDKSATVSLMNPMIYMFERSNIVAKLRYN